MSNVVLQESAVSVKISGNLAKRLQKFRKLGGFDTTDDYVSFVLRSVLEEIENPALRWSGGDENDIDEAELNQIKEELRPLIQISC
jgi:hypothetical protein